MNNDKKQIIMLFYQFKLLFIAYLIIPLSRSARVEGVPKKRQIYREQVAPRAGGRIPDSAFETDRLFLNQLQKHGISIPDGVVPQQRSPEVYPYFNRSSRKVYRIALSTDDRYRPYIEGHFQYPELTATDTTYLYPPIHGEKDDSTSSTIILPVYRNFRLQNPTQLNPVTFQMKDEIHFYPKAKSYQNFNIIHSKYSAIPGSRLDSKTYFPELAEDRFFKNEYFNEVLDDNDFDFKAWNV